MKKTPLLLLIAAILTTQFAFGQKNEPSNFQNIDLKELRKAFVNQLMEDGLIDRRKDDIHLALRTETTLLNDKILAKEFHEKYGNLAEKFDIQRGSYRVIYITRQCIAVGDFLEDSFSGRIDGKFSLNDLTVSIR